MLVETLAWGQFADVENVNFWRKLEEKTFGMEVSQKNLPATRSKDFLYGGELEEVAYMPDHFTETGTSFFSLIISSIS